MDNGAGFRTAYDYWPMTPNAGGNGNGDFRLRSIKHFRDADVIAGQHEYSYAPAGIITQWAQSGEGQGDSFRYELGYDPANQLTGAVKKSVASGTELERSAWRYDAAGNREVEQRSVASGGGSYATSFTQASHNNVNQVTSRTGGSGELEVEGRVNELATVSIGGTAPSAFWKREDGQYGFRGKKSVAAGANTLSVTATDASGNVASTNTAVNASGSGMPSVTYDLAGNQLSDGTRSYTWDAASRLIQINYPGTGNRTEFTYDGLSRRVREKEYTDSGIIGDRHFIWEGLTLAERRNAGSNELERRYYAQGWAAGAAETADIYDANFYRRDHLGSVRDVVNVRFGTIFQAEYDLWGNRTVASSYAGDSSDTDFGYTGHYLHARSGLYLAPFRAYSTELARWLSRDPLENAEVREGTNLYGYVFGNPARWRDPDGLEALPGGFSGGATVCDGDGKIKMMLSDDIKKGNSDVKACVEKHEQQHKHDLGREFPDACSGVKPGGNPVYPHHTGFLLRSECNAHTAEAKCLKEAADKCPDPAGKEMLKKAQTASQKWADNYCEQAKKWY
jgi:RHS repeat-associated protein